MKKNSWDVYYKKTKIFRDWDKKKPDISALEKKLLTLPREKLIEKKEITIKPLTKVSTVLETKLTKDLIHGRVRLAPAKLTKQILQTPIADPFMGFPPRPSEQKKKEILTTEQETKTWILGNKFEQSCLGKIKNCGFAIDIEVSRYSKKMSPPKAKQIDTSHFPINF